MRVNWKRSKSSMQGHGVEVAHVGSEFWVRDAGRIELPPLKFTEEEWWAFCDGVLAGEFRF
jgi:hypothetical protein